MCSFLGRFEVPFAIALFSVKLSSSGSWLPLPTLPSCFELHRMFLLSVWLQLSIAGLDLPTPCVLIALPLLVSATILVCSASEVDPTLVISIADHSSKLADHLLFLL